MTDKLQTKRNKTVMAFLAIVSSIAIVLSSCAKKATVNPATQFVGTWNGTNTCGGYATLTLVAGSGSTVLMAAGTDSCLKTVTYTLTAYGNSVVDTQTVKDGCGDIFTTTITGSLNGGTLTVSINDGVGACVFTGTKKY